MHKFHSPGTVTHSYRSTSTPHLNIRFESHFIPHIVINLPVAVEVFFESLLSIYKRQMRRNRTGLT